MATSGPAMGARPTSSTPHAPSQSGVPVRNGKGAKDATTRKMGRPTHHQTSKLARRVAEDPAKAGWKLERVITDNGNEFRAGFDHLLTAQQIRHTRIRPGRPQTNGHVERLHKTIVDECWRPSFARYLHVTYGGHRRDLAEYVRIYNTDRAHNGRLTKGRIPADIIDPRPQDQTPSMTHTCRYNSGRVHARPSAARVTAPTAAAGHGRGATPSASSKDSPCQPCSAMRSMTSRR